MVGVFGLRQVQFRRQFRTNIIVINVHFGVGWFSGCGRETRMWM